VRLPAESLCTRHQIVRAINHGKDKSHQRGKNLPNHDDHVDQQKRADSTVGVLAFKD
jgi:hypothetical protein